MKIAFVCSGQGSQKTGMGKELYETYSICKETFEEANNALGFSISDICFRPENEEKLNKTEFCQPAILTHSVAAARLLMSQGIFPEMLCGLSLGEYTALVLSEAISFSDAVRLVYKRGMLMESAVPSGYGAMCAIMDLDLFSVEKAISSTSGLNVGAVYVSNFNMPGQIVISGEKEGVKKAALAAQEFGAKKTVMLQVSGPFHTPFLQPAANKLKEELQKIDWKPMKYPVVSNVDAKIIPFEADIVPLLTKQMTHPVRFMQCVEEMIARRVTHFVEVGPSKTLSAFISRTNRSVMVLNVEDERSYQKTRKNMLLPNSPPILS